MITKTSLKHPSLLLNIKQQVVNAIRARNVACDVVNSRGKIVMSVIHIGNGDFRVNDDNYNDITDLVKNSLKEFHKKL